MKTSTPCFERGSLSPNYRCANDKQILLYRGPRYNTEIGQGPVFGGGRFPGTPLRPIACKFCYTADRGIINVSQRKMSAVLLCVRPGSFGATETAPVQMKTSTGVNFIGFSSQEVGSYYMRRIGIRGEHYDFISLGAFFDTAPAEGRKKSKIVFFRSEDDVDIHARDRAKFPYRDYELSPDEIPKEG